MKRILLYIIFTVCASLAADAQNPLKALKNMLEQPSEPRFDDKAFAGKPLSKKDAESAATMIYQYVVQNDSARRNGFIEAKALLHGKYRMPFTYKIFGDKPADGRSLYISMHGGGNTSDEVNNKQWQNQMRLYAPKEGVYFVPRSAVNDWNMWFQPHVDTLFDLIIQTAVAEWDVNPDKVYLMGYSAGGDGAYRLAPRLADRWAAASMMAGHPGGVSPVNLRNIGFMLWMGAEDKAYDRNLQAAKFGKLLDDLREADTAAYRHETHIVAGKGHWMEHADTVAVPWMAQFRRNPCPDKVVWRQDDVPHDSFYWLSVPANEATEGKCATVERRGNTFTVSRNDYKRLTIGLNDNMIDFRKPVKIIVNGNTVFDAKVERTIIDIYHSITKRKDKGLIFHAFIEINIF
ncbi:MAG: alpha/beta hydrolase [Prevotellaceae bacterium]|jgi:poly(3-hydroxybutyrate) depolymerase|nr:alpha/beta hydrolase [Prevotellaceae bacterium]